MTDIATILTDTARISELPQWLRAECQRAADEINKLCAELAQLSDYNAAMIASYTTMINEQQAELARLKAPRKLPMPSVVATEWRAISGNPISPTSCLSDFARWLAAHWGIELEGK
jgi:hypothetical protein